MKIAFLTVIAFLAIPLIILFSVTIFAWCASKAIIGFLTEGLF